MLKPEFVVLVNNKNEFLGTEEKMKAHQEGLLHRAFSVFIFRKRASTVEFLMQQRQATKYHCAGLWSNTCCGHPRVDESILQAGQRRLKEEMSLDIPLMEVGTFQYLAHLDNGLIEHEFDHVLLGQFDEKTPIECNPMEVQDYRWESFSELTKALNHSSERYTPWLKSAFGFIQEELCLKYSSR